MAKAGELERDRAVHDLRSCLDVDVVQVAAAIRFLVAESRVLLDFVLDVDVQPIRCQGVDQLDETRQVDDDGTVDLEVGDLADGTLEGPQPPKELGRAAAARAVLRVPGRMYVGRLVP